jgi:death-on-curing protein
VSREPTWVSKSAIVAIHECLLAEHGGARGLLDEGKLDAALASPRNHFAHGQADLLRLATAYACAITRDHPFQDGNKRVALTIAGVFLELNRLRLTAPDAVSVMLALANRQVDEVGFVRWLRGSSSKIPKRSTVPRKGRRGVRRVRRRST